MHSLKLGLGPVYKVADLGHRRIVSGGDGAVDFEMTDTAWPSPSSAKSSFLSRCPGFPPVLSHIARGSAAVGGSGVPAALIAAIVMGTRASIAKIGWSIAGSVAVIAGPITCVGSAVTRAGISTRTRGGRTPSQRCYQTKRCQDSPLELHRRYLPIQRGTRWSAAKTTRYCRLGSRCQLPPV